GRSAEAFALRRCENGALRNLLRVAAARASTRRPQSDAESAETSARRTSGGSAGRSSGRREAAACDAPTTPRSSRYLLWVRERDHSVTGISLRVSAVSAVFLRSLPSLTRTQGDSLTSSGWQPPTGSRAR